MIGGRVDVCVDGSFRAVCDSGWDDLDAAVVCSSMGYNSPFYGKVYILYKVEINVFAHIGVPHSLHLR